MEEDVPPLSMLGCGRTTLGTGEANCADFTMGGREKTTQLPARPTHPKSLPKPDAEEDR